MTQASRGYLVLGPESSGTRMTARLLVAAGCRMTAVVGGDDVEEEALNSHPPVIRRSAPHWRPPLGPFEWPDVPHLARLLFVDEVWAVITTRDVFAMAMSQAQRSHVPDLDAAYANIRRAYLEIFEGLSEARIPYVMSSYESSVSRPEYRRRLLSHLGLPATELEAFDGNEKWYRIEGDAESPEPGDHQGTQAGVARSRTRS